MAPTNETMDFSGHVVLVTGAGRGIGLAIVQLLAQRGASVALNDVDAALLNSVTAAIRDGGGDVAPFVADVRDPEAVEQMIHDITDWRGRLNSLVNNAGIGGTGKTLLELTLEEWREMLEMDLTSVFLTCRAAVPVMQRQGSGCIVNISSVSALMGVSGSTHYTAAKAGIIGFSKSLALEVAPDRIRVNVVAPGLIDTTMSRARGIDHQRHLVIWPRIGVPADIASTVIFLLSSESEFITGQVISPNGGAYM